MKFPLAWHEASLKALTHSLSVAEREATSAGQKAQELRDMVKKLQSQLDRARDEGRTEFDPEKFNIRGNK